MSSSIRSTDVRTHDASSPGGGDVVPEDAFIDLTDGDIQILLENCLEENKVLRKENDMFNTYLERVEQASVRGDDGSGIDASPEEEIPSSVAQLKLTPELKCEVATRELEETRDEIEQAKEVTERNIENLKAIIEETDIRSAELKKASYEFRRDIVHGAVNPRTKKIIAEKVVRYLEEKLRSRDTLIEKLRLKNSTLKVQKNKLHLQLRQKEEMGEVLHAIDFDQLKIENKQYIEKIEERNQELLKLKLTAGNTLQILNTHKKKLVHLTMESERLRSEMQYRDELLAKIASESATVDTERYNAERVNKQLRQQLENYKVPTVLDYINEKADHAELLKKLKNWERKVEIARMALQKQKRIWKQLQRETNTMQWGCMDSEAFTTYTAL